RLPPPARAAPRRARTWSPPGCGRNGPAQPRPPARAHGPGWPRCARGRGRGSAQPCDARLAARCRAFAAVREETLVADRAAPERRDGRDARGVQARAGDQAQVDVRMALDPGRERLVDVRTDLVAARPGAR